MQIARPIVVVHHVHVHREAALVAGFDEFFERIGSAVGAFHREDVTRVVTPAVPPGEFVDRHEQDAVHPHLHQMVELADGVAQGPGLAVVRIRIVECPGMQLVDDQFAQRGGRRTVVATPVERRCVIDDAFAIRRGDHAGPRILALEFAIDQEHVFVPGFGPANFEGPNAGGAFLFHDVAARIPVVERADDRHRFGIRRPRAEQRAGHPAGGRLLHDGPEFAGEAARSGTNRRSHRGRESEDREDETHRHEAVTTKSSGRAGDLSFADCSGGNAFARFHTRLRSSLRAAMAKLFQLYETQHFRHMTTSSAPASRARCV